MLRDPATRIPNVPCVATVAWVLMLAILATGPALAFEDHGIGPVGGEVSTSLASPWAAGAFYVGTAVGVYRLPAGGAQWEYASGGLPLGTVTGLAPGQDAGHLLCGIAYPTARGVYRTSDDGATWIARNTGLGDLTVYAIEADPSTPGLFYAATETGVYWTTNSGDSWAARGMAGKSVREVRVDPSNPTRAWASAAFDGIYRTTNQGATWDYASTGITGTKLFQDIKTTADGQRVYAVGWTTYRSTNGGDSWTAIGAGFLPPFGIYSAMEIVGEPSDIVLVELGTGVWRSTNAGDTWSQVGPSSPSLVEFQTICKDRTAPTRLLAGALGGEIFLTQSVGADGWTPLTTGISSSFLLSAAVQGSRWIAGTVRGVYVSEDWGRNWGKSDLVYDIGAEINSVVFDPQDAMTLYCGNTNGFFEGDVYRSTDGGWHWDVIQRGDGPVRAVAVDPANPLRLYAGYSCDVIPGGVYRSTDGGTSWIDESLGDVCVYALEVNAANPSIVLAGTSNGVYRSTDSGDTWSARGPNGADVVDLSRDAVIAGRFYAATYGSRAYRSTDGGLTWGALGGFELPGFLWSIDGGDANAGVLAGTETGGIWKLTGNLWTQLPADDQPPIRNVRCLLSLPELGRFLAGTWGAGLWEYLSDPAAAPTAPLETARGLAIEGSPSRGPFLVRLPRSRPGPVSIEITDLAGRRIRGMTDARAPAGAEWTWDARDEAGRPVAAGVYLVLARHARGVERGKVCVVR